MLSLYRFDHQSSFILTNLIKVTLSFEPLLKFIDFVGYMLLYGGLSLLLSWCLSFNLFQPFSRYLTSIAGKSEQLDTHQKIASDYSSLSFRITLKTVYFVISVKFCLFMSYRLYFSR